MVDSVWYLTPNSDNSQDMAYPAGDKPDAPIDILPAAVQDLAATATGTNTIRLDWTEVANATAYNVQRSPDNAIWSDIDSTPAPPYNAVNLVDGKQYWFRLFASNLNGWGNVSNTATAVTDEIEIPVAGDAVIFDDFERYASGTQLNNIAPPTALFGSAWVAPEVGTIFPGTVEISDQEAEAGTKSVMLRYAASIAPAGSNAAQTFRLASYYSSLTLEWDLFVPANLNAENIVSGQQLLRLWGDSESEQMQVGLNIHGESAQVMTAYAVKNEGGGIGSDWAHPINNFITAADLGTWINIKIKVDAPTSSSDGNIQIWRNDVSVSNYAYDNYNAGEPNGYKNGQIGGWCSGGYANQTAWYVDNFKVLTNNDAEWAGLAPNRFVTATATGGGTGSASDPWTLAEGMSNIVAGDTLGLYPGVYPGVIPPAAAADASKLRLYPAFYPASSGTASQPIRIVAQFPAAQHTNASLYTDIRSGSTTDGTAPDVGGWAAFGTRHCDYVEWIGIYSSGTDANNKWTYDSAPCMVRSTTGSKISLCKLIGSDSDYNDGSRNYSAVRMEWAHNTELSDNYMADFYSNNKTNSAGVILYDSRNYTITHNTIDRCTHGVQPKGGGGENNLYGEISYNLISNTRNGFRFHGPYFGPAGERNPIHHNLIISSTYFMEKTSTTVDGSNTDLMDGVDFYNNTFANGGNSDGIMLWGFLQSGVKSNTSKNNIMSSSGPHVVTYSGGGSDSIAEHVDSNYNCIHAPNYMTKPSTYSIASWNAAYSQEVGSFDDDPLFVGGGDYRLQALSPCRDTGEGGVTMGCYVTGDETIGVR